MNFNEKILENKTEGIKAGSIDTLQVNLGKLCNLECKHCHVGAGPNRTEVMSHETVESLLEILKNDNFKVIDLTGGAPEMHEDLQYIIEEARKLDKEIIVRTNLVTLFYDQYKDLAKVYRDNRATVIASLPCYSKENVEAQRGDGVFEKSIESLKYLNSLGYGKEKDLELNLVYNPGGSFLPGPQDGLEKAYKEKLKDDFDIVFNNLFTITNLPLGRFKDELEEKGDYKDYMKLLEDNYNPNTLDNLMCRSQISISWDGYIYDCDFNQVIDLKSKPKLHIKDYDFDQLINRDIALANHCYGCTAGAGSSCGGALE